MRLELVVRYQSVQHPDKYIQNRCKAHPAYIGNLEQPGWLRELIETDYHQGYRKPKNDYRQERIERRLESKKYYGPKDVQNKLNCEYPERFPYLFFRNPFVPNQISGDSH